MEELSKASISGKIVNYKRRHEDELEASVKNLKKEKKLKAKHYSSPHPCKKCEMVATTPTNLSKHMTYHGSYQKYTCPLCDYSCKRKGKVNNHLRMFHTRAEDVLGDDYNTVLEVLGSDDDDEVSFMQLYDESTSAFQNAKETTQQDDLKTITAKTEEIHDESDEIDNLQQLSLDTLKKKEKSFQIKIAKLQLEIEGKLRFLETRQALFYRETSCGLMSRKVELILLASNLDKESSEFSEIKKEEEEVEAELRDAIVKQSSVSSVLKEIDKIPGKVRLLQPGEFSELKNSVGALFSKFRETNEQLALIVKRKRVLEEENWMERFAKLD